MNASLRLREKLRPVKVAHVITGLGIGGAETMLYRLLSTLDPGHFDSSVISLIQGGEMAASIEALGVPVENAGMRRGIPDPRKIARLTHLLRKAAPDVVQTWMYHSDLLGGIAARAVGGSAIAWNLRHSNLDPATNSLSTRATARVNARLSRFLPDRIICGSRAAREAHAAIGYDSARMVVIPNGFDVEQFRPDMACRESIRQELGLGPEILLVGLIARFHPEKDHRTFVRAAGRIAARLPNVHFLLAGEGVHEGAPSLIDWMDAAGVRDRITLLGRRPDVNKLLSALDLFMLSSQGEGFPNVVGEAMATGVPCVTTDSGDCKWILGSTGTVVPRGNSEALADASIAILESPERERRALGIAARQRIISCFSLKKAADQYGDVYDSMARERNHLDTPLR